MQLLWWHWMVFGMGLALVELALFSFFIIWFAVGALLVGVVLALLPNLGFAAQILLWTAVSVAMTVLWFKFFRPANRTRSGQADEVLGEIGVLLSAIEPVGSSSGRSEVRFQKPIMGAERWTCLADEPIAAGTRVKVLAVDGQFLKVGKL